MMSTELERYKSMIDSKTGEIDSLKQSLKLYESNMREYTII